MLTLQFCEEGASRRQRTPLNVGWCKLFDAGLSILLSVVYQLGLHQYVAPHNIQELHEIHANARPTAVAYVSTIFLLYLVGLGLILVHYMNSSYGSWTWNLDDLWEELRPAFTKPKPKWEPKTRGE